MVAPIMSLYKNIHNKRRRIKAGSGEKMRKPGDEGAPTKQAFVDSAKTAKSTLRKKMKKKYGKKATA